MHTPLPGMVTSLLGGYVALSILETVVGMQSVNTAAGGAAVGLVAGVFDTSMHLCHPLFGALPSVCTPSSSWGICSWPPASPCAFS